MRKWKQAPRFHWNNLGGILQSRTYDLERIINLVLLSTGILLGVDIRIQNNFKRQLNELLKHLLR